MGDDFTIDDFGLDDVYDVTLKNGVKVSITELVLDYFIKEKENEQAALESMFSRGVDDRVNRMIKNGETIPTEVYNGE